MSRTTEKAKGGKTEHNIAVEIKKGERWRKSGGTGWPAALLTLLFRHQMLTLLLQASVSRKKI
jgi:hypothetical protein